MHSVVRIDVDSRRNRAELPNLKRRGAAIEQDIRADPSLRSDFNSAENQGAIIDAGAFGKSQTLGPLPTVEHPVLKRQAAVEFGAQLLVLFLIKGAQALD